MILRPLSLLLTYFSIVCSAFSTHASPAAFFWDKEIDSALTVRDNFFASCGISGQDSLFGLTSNSISATLADKIINSPNKEHAWYNFFSGALLLYSDSPSESTKETADAYFNGALQTAAVDPGTTWLLFCAFKKLNVLTWQEKSIQQLYKIMLTTGTQRAPAIVQQLLFYGLKDPASLKNGHRDFYLAWANKFDNRLIWAQFWKAYYSFLTNPIESLSLIVNEFSLHTATWSFSLGLAAIAWDWLGIFILICICALMALLAARHLPGATHKISHRFPKIVPPLLRQVFAIIIVLSVLFFGIIPFLWFLAFVLWRQLPTSRKITAGIALVLLALTPCYIFISDILMQPTLPKNPLALYQRSLGEGYSTDLEQTLRADAQTPKNYIALVALANCALKNNNIALAQSAISRAEKIKPEDPVVLLCAGNTSFFAQDFNKANEYFSRCLKLFPEMETSFFNPCTYYFSTMRITEGISLIENATKLNSERISDYIKTNDDYFGSTWPMLRQYIQPDYENVYFAKNILVDYKKASQTAPILFGTLFFGISPIGYLIMSGIFFIILLLWGISSGSSRKFFCKQCDIPICQSCKRSIYCSSCYALVGDITNETLAQQMGGRISRRTKLIDASIQCAFNLALPGSGVLLKNVKFLFIPTLQVLFGIALYASLWITVNAHSSYPQWVLSCITTPLSLCIGFYFMVCALGTLVKFGTLLTRIFGNGAQRKS